MKKEEIIDKIKEYVDARNTINAYYVTYKPTENARSQKWGSVKNETVIVDILDEIEKSDVCIQGNLPIVRFIVYSEDQCLAFIENPLWDCVNDESSESHVVMTIPFISRDGQFGMVKDWCANRFRITDSDIKGELIGFPLGVVVRMMELQFEQTNHHNIDVFCEDVGADSKKCGFDWDATVEGFDFWYWVINDRKFESVFFAKYPDYKKYNM